MLEADPYPPTPVERELEKTSFEHAAVEASTLALNTTLQNINHEPVVIPARRIHVVPDSALQRITSSEAEGVVRHGHVYVRRLRDQVDFTRALTHELCHVASFYQLQVVQKAEAPRRLHVWDRRMGFLLQPRRDKTATGPKEAASFHGINEGATEFLANIVRRSLSSRHQLDLDPRDASRLLETYAYPDWVTVVDQAIKIVAAHEKRDYVVVRDQFLTDYLGGTFGFFQHLESVKPGSTAMLRTLDSSAEEAHQALAWFAKPV